MNRLKLDVHVMNSDFFGLALSFNVSPASCDNPDHYMEYIKFSAISDNKAGQSLTHIFVDESQHKLAGYIALRATSLISKGQHGEHIVHPSLEIAELAVAEEYERKQVGTQMVEFAFLTADTLRQEHLGIKYIVLCADHRAVGFYEKLGFGRIDDLYQVPRDGMNSDCVPMYIQLPEN